MNDWSLLYDDIIEKCSYLYVRSSDMGNNVWAGITCWWTFLLRQDTFPATSDNLFYNLEIQYTIYTSIKHWHIKSFFDEKTHWPVRNDGAMVSTDPVWYYLPPWMFWQNRDMWSRRFRLRWESRPKSLDASAGISNFRITASPVDDINDRVLCCKPIKPIVFCFRHFIAFHYHHHTRLLMGIDHM